MSYYSSLQWRRKGRGLSRRRLTSRTACIGGRIAVISEPCKNALLWLSEPCKNALLWRSGWLRRRLINELALGIVCILAAARGVHNANAIGIGIAAVSTRRRKNEFWSMISSAELMRATDTADTGCFVEEVACPLLADAPPRDVLEGLPRAPTFQ